MRGKEDKNETACKLIELVETEEIRAQQEHQQRPDSPSVNMLWDEWDM